MRTVTLLLIGFSLTPILALGQDKYWPRINELAKSGTGQGNPELEAYLKSLTPEEMLQAARECAQWTQRMDPEEHWEMRGLLISLTLAFYRADKGGLPDDRLNALLKCVADNKEERFLRESLLGLLRSSEYWTRLTEGQRKQCLRCFLATFLDKKAPARLRGETCLVMAQEIAEIYRVVINRDPNVRTLSNDKAKYRNLDKLLRAGEVPLEPETRKSLKAVRDEITSITLTLAARSKDPTEPPEVQKRIEQALETFAKLPVPPEAKP